MASEGEGLRQRGADNPQADATSEKKVTKGDKQDAKQEEQAADVQDEESSGGAMMLLGAAGALALLGCCVVAVIGTQRALPELARCGTATVTKLAGSMDDVVWLTPFMVGATHIKAKHGAVYCGLFATEVCLCTAVTAVFEIAIGLMLPQRFAERGWDVSFIMQLVGGSALAFYTVKLFRESGDDDDDDEDTSGKELGVKQLLVIGVLGSLDDMCLQATTLASGAFAFRHLMVGVLLGCSVVVGVCWGASQLQFVMEAAAKVPMWCIVGALAAMTLGGAFFG